MFSSTRPLSRRDALRVAAGVALGVPVLASATACSDSADSADVVQIDALIAQSELARRDAAQATAAIALLPERAGALSVVAAERTAHADALDAEIARTAPAASTTPVPATTTTPIAAPPTLDQLRADLAQSQQEAARLARIESGHRAGLLGSISAACACQQAVLLP